MIIEDHEKPLIRKRPSDFGSLPTSQEPKKQEESPLQRRELASSQEYGSGSPSGNLSSGVLLLEKAIKEEKFIPSLLTYQRQLLKAIFEHVRIQETRAKDYERNLNNSFIIDIILLDIERVKYLIKAYLRIRLSKVIVWLYVRKH